MSTRSSNIGWVLAVGLLVAGPAFAADEIIPVPFSPQNINLPHPAHESANMTLKAVIRDAGCATYDVWWDVNRDGNFDDDAVRRVNRVSATNSVPDIGRTFVTPEVDRDRSWNVNVRVRNLCDATEKFGTFRIFIYDFTPSNVAENWTDDQLELMDVMAVQESLWYQHRKMAGLSGQGTAQIVGRNTYGDATGMAMWQFTINGRMPAYPPGTYNPYNQPVPNGWAAINDQRWKDDPYAETVMRMVNYFAVGYGYYNINRDDEDNTCGYDAVGNVIRCARLADTSDGRGLYSYSQNAYRTGIHTGALATVLPALAGTRLQTGPLAGELWEYAVQQQADLVGAQQIDGGAGMGGVYYTYLNGSYSGAYSDASTSQWAYIGLESAEIVGAPYGVFVNNRHKYRIASNLIVNQRGDWKSGYRSTSGRGDIKLTGGAMVGSRWLGLHTMARGDNSQPFPNETTYTRDEMRQAYDRYLSGLSRDWTLARHVGSHWQDSIFEDGDYLCGQPNGIFNGPRCGSTYAMYSLQKGFRTGSPELEQVGNHDWYRQFSTYYLRAMSRIADPANPQSGYDTFGYVVDEYCQNHSVTCSYGGGTLAAAMAGLVLTPSIFRPKPVAIFEAQPTEVTEGCLGGNAGRVTFDHSDSFHPNADSRIVAYQYDVDPDNGLWWDTGAAPDAVTPNAQAGLQQQIDYRFMRAGTFDVTLRVIDVDGQTKTTNRSVQVNPAANVAPTAAHGGPYTIEENGALQLAAVLHDANEGCGDVLSATWDLDNDGAFDDANGPSSLVPWGVLENLPRGVASTIRVRIVDSDGAVTTVDTSVIIYAREPVASARANPAPAACGQQVTFDASASFHPNPARNIQAYEWDVEGDASPDGAGVVFRFAFAQFGVYPVTLTVRDNFGRANSETFDLTVDQGNHAPVARTSTDSYVVLEGDDAVLDARPSTDPDVACGDEIASYGWDLDGDGAFDDAVGALPTIGWAELAEIANYDGDPVQITVALQVTDSFGLTSSTATKITLFSPEPIAEVVQSPDPAPINLVTGVSRVRLDGRESRSPIPGLEIVGHAWDLDDDGIFEINNSAIVIFEKVFAPVPGPGDIPEVNVRMRVTDENQRTSETRFRVDYRVPPTPPTADADPTEPPEQGYHILLGDPIVLDGSRSFDPDSVDFGDYIQFYRWDLTYDEADGFQVDVSLADPDGDGDGRSTVSAEELADGGIAAAGEYELRIQVEDTTLLTNEDSAPLYVYEREPVATAFADPNPAGCGARVTLDARGSNHPHPEIAPVAWRWDFDGDGQYDDAEGSVVSTRFDTFSFNGAFSVGLEVEDNRGSVGRSDILVTVSDGNQPAVANAGGRRNGDGEVIGPYVIAVGDFLSMSGLGSHDPNGACGDAVVTYQWDVGNDGQFDVVGQDPAALTWAELTALGIDEAGDYSIRLRVADRFGATGESVATLRVVDGPKANVVARPNRASCAQLVEFDASGSGTDGPGGLDFDLVDYAWDVDGDGDYSDAEGQSISLPATAQGVEAGEQFMDVSVRVTDLGGRTHSQTARVIIESPNVAPLADAGGPYATGPDLAGFVSVWLDGRGSTEPNAPCDEIVVYKWDTDGDGLYGDDDPDGDLVGARVEYNNPAWRVNTVDTVRLIVCDTEGLCSAPGEADVQVGFQPPPGAEIISPRALEGDCVNGGQVDIVISVSHPQGQMVTIKLDVGGQRIAEQNAQTNADGSPSVIVIPVNANLIPEGKHPISLNVIDALFNSVFADAGGRVTFDRTPPTVTIDENLQEGTCYLANDLPEVAVEVVDLIDDAPSRSVSVTANGCGRALTARATDACGNAAVDVRGYLVAEPVEVAINGADEGSLVATARMSWDVVGEQACAANVIGSISRDGGANQAYPENQLVNQPGNYALTVQSDNCAGVGGMTIRSFTVNAPPVSVPVPPGHGYADLGALPPGVASGYILDEGSRLELEGLNSRPPELIDSIAEFAWDLDGDGDYSDAAGPSQVFSTEEQGVFLAGLRVTDSLGATDSEIFQVTVLDVDPIIDPGGPYVVDQGQVLQVDASRTRPGSDADRLTRFEWTWGDGSANTDGPDAAIATHTYDDDGQYNALLTVQDEDSAQDLIVQVQVVDVDPQINAIGIPEELVEILPQAFTLDVEPGAPRDPILRIEWDFNGDNVPDCIWPAPNGGAEACTSNDGRSAQWHYREAGPKTVTVRVHDPDSVATVALPADVREITLAELVTYTEEQVVVQSNEPDAPLAALFQLRGIDANLADAGWGERNDFRGNTFIALDGVFGKLVRAQAAGMNFGLELWALSRQVRREVRRLKTDIEVREDGPEQHHPSIQRADSYLENLDAEYGDEEFEDDVYANNLLRAKRAQVAWQNAYEAFFWLQDSVDPCAGVGFDLPDIEDPVEQTEAGNEVNVRLAEALTGLTQELDAYTTAGGNEDPGPGRDNVLVALGQIRIVQALMALDITIFCEEGRRCVTDREALDAELRAMDIAADFDTAATHGAYHRQWQACLVEAVKFRIEVSLLRVEYVCGQNTGVSQTARAAQEIGLSLYDDGLKSDALTYYANPDRRCLLIETYNQCLVEQLPETNEPYDLPEYCNAN